MLVPDSEWVYAPYLMFDARSVLARTLSFSERIHRNAYSIPSIAIELGVRVRYIADPSLAVIGLCMRHDDDIVIALNDAVESTSWDMAALIHELGHAVIDQVAPACAGKLARVEERNAWVRGIYVAISRFLVEGIAEGNLTPWEVAARCSVPEAIVHARMALAEVLGEIEGDVSKGYDRLRDELLMIEAWLEDGRACGFREWSAA